MIEAQTVPSNARKQLSIRRRSVPPPMVGRDVILWIESSPVRPPQRVEPGKLGELQLADVSASFEDCELPPVSTEAIAGTLIQDVG